MKHFIEGFLGFCGDLWVDGDFGLFGLEGFESGLQVVFFHVEAEVAEAVEFFVWEGLFEAFGHAAFGEDEEFGGGVVFGGFDHAGGGGDVVGDFEDFGAGFGMGDDFGVGVGYFGFFEVFAIDEVVDRAVAVPGDDLFFGHAVGNICGEVFVGYEDYFLLGHFADDFDGVGGGAADIGDGFDSGGGINIGNDGGVGVLFFESF